jgi:hypothetical protein
VFSPSEDLPASEGIVEVEVFHRDGVHGFNRYSFVGSD